MVDESNTAELLVVTGMSGAGRSTVANALEDLGWYVVDNLPPQMLKPLIDLLNRAGNSLPRIAAVVDIRGRDFFATFEEMLHGLRDGIPVRVLFLDAADSTLVRRFEAVRRPHPLQGGGTLLDGIAAERARLATVRESADLVIDTSELNIHQLATQVTDAFSVTGQPSLKLTVMSFGFKYGLPQDADMVADARFLPNPYWQPDLRHLTGKDEVVADFVLHQPGAQEFIDAYLAVLEPVLAGFVRENKRHVTIAIGCTGGKHRSVAIAEALAHRLSGLAGVTAQTRHRDMGRE
ncbi:MAG TPA: RNase adapter RapZ [Candidatus Lumbricidophila sp.]|nr:RNase adapter RapZ [Candidatus Lumbricidophila sp.]